MPVAKTRRTRLQPDERRAQLVACAIPAFAEHGLARATHSHVAGRAGTSVSTVHFYFRTREDLVDAVLSAVEARQYDLVRNTLEGPGSVRDCLTALAVQFAEEARDETDLIKVWLDWSTGVRADLWPRYLALSESFNDMAQKLLIRGKRDGSVSAHLNAKAVARFFIGGGHTVALMQFAGASQREFDIFIDQLVRMTMGNGFDDTSEA